MARAVTCPVCYGRGKVRRDSIHGSKEETCNGCNGKGWVEVSDTYYPPRYRPLEFPPRPRYPRIQYKICIQHGYARCLCGRH